MTCITKTYQEDKTGTPTTATTSIGISVKNELKRSIKPFHVFMMSTATGIGTGLLVGNGRSIAIAGVGGTLIGYLIIGVMLICCMQTVGELSLIHI